MKNLTLIICCILSFYFSNSQNLVPNWSFEDTVTCPTALTQIDKAVGWSSFKESPDYFNSCAPVNPPQNVSVPNNQWGSQFPKTGEGYAGFGAFGVSASNLREYLGIELINNLVVGEKYFISFYVSTAFGYANGQYPGLASNNIGIKFSTVQFSPSNPAPINNFAHINESNIINDTINWIKISGSFIADSAYKYIIIGNFFDDINTSYVMIGTNPTVAYYYLDDIKVSNDSEFVNSVNTINDINLIEIFPNPARDWVVIEGRYFSKVSLFDVLGNLCFSTEVSSSSLKIDISAYRRGMYFLLIETEKKIIKRKLLIN